MTDTPTTGATAATLSGRIATWVTALRYEDLPGEVAGRTKLLILDQLGLQLRGATLPNVQPILRLADAQPGKAEATLAHSGARTTVSQAAWVNGTLGHSAEYDDAHPLAWHTNSAVIPAALALAEREHASGRELITAVVAGIQVMGLLGAALPTMVAPLDVVRQLRTEHDIKPADIARIRVGLVDFAVGHGASITRPPDAISAQFSLAFSIGLQFITGNNAPSDYFDAGRRTDPEILAIGDLVEPYPMPIPEGDPIFSTKVDIELKDGTTYSAYQAGFRGHPSHPATETDVERKFRDNVEGLISADRADALVALANSLETQDSLAPVTALLGVDDRRNGSGGSVSIGAADHRVEISPVNLPELALDDAVQGDELASRQLPAQPA